MHEKPNTHHVTKWGLIVVLVFIGGFLLWAFLAPLESAAVAPGKVVVSGSTRVIQHLEGGIVKAIYVKDGDQVKKGQALMQLQDVQAKAASQINRKELWELSASESRLLAEIEDKPKVVYSNDLLSEKANPVANRIMDLQDAQFYSNQKAFKGNVETYEQRIIQLKEQINGRQAQYQSSTNQLKYIKEELKDVKVLAEKRLIKQSRLYALQREAANLLGQQGENQAAIAELKQKIGEVNIQLNTVKTEHRKTLLDELRKTQKQLGEVLEREKASGDILSRTTITAPVSGVVADLSVRTIGGVVKPGEKIMTIVPKHEDLIIEARVMPLDIDVVHAGLKAKVRMSGLSQRNVPTLLGSVTHVSADAYTDERTGESYFEADVSIPKEELNKLGNQALAPGMPAEVMIITQKLTPWEYFTKPIKNSFSRAFREQ